LSTGSSTATATESYKEWAAKAGEQAEEIAKEIHWRSSGETVKNHGGQSVLAAKMVLEVKANRMRNADCGMEIP
jgi:hypothetical protein